MFNQDSQRDSCFEIFIILYPQMHRITIIVSNTKRADDDETESIKLLQFTTMDPIQNNFVKIISTPHI